MPLLVDCPGCERPLPVGGVGEGVVRCDGCGRLYEARIGSVDTGAAAYRTARQVALAPWIPPPPAVRGGSLVEGPRALEIVFAPPMRGRVAASVALIALGLALRVFLPGIVAFPVLFAFGFLALQLLQRRPVERLLLNERELVWERRQGGALVASNAVALERVRKVDPDGRTVRVIVDDGVWEIGAPDSEVATYVAARAAHLLPPTRHEDDRLQLPDGSQR